MPQVVAVNANGKKQTIPAHWLDHPVLSVGFRLPPSTGATKDPAAPRRGKRVGPDANTKADKADTETPATGDEKE